MADTFQIDIATPEKLVLQQQADSAQIPGKDGYMGILPGHAALLSELAEGTLSVTLKRPDAEFPYHRRIRRGPRQSREGAGG